MNPYQTVITMLQKNEQGPTLQTIKMVEHVLKKSSTPMTIPELKRALPKQIHHRILMIILEYLEESNKIYAGIKGITWIHTDPLSLRKMISSGTKH